jgi:hypothetical protein
MFVPESKGYKPNTQTIRGLLEDGEVAVAMLQIGFTSKVLTNQRLLFLDLTESRIKEYISLLSVEEFSFNSPAGIPRLDAVMKDGTTIKIGTFDGKHVEKIKEVFASTLSQVASGKSATALAPISQEPIPTPDAPPPIEDSVAAEERVRTNSLKTFPNWLLKSISSHKRSDEKLLMVITEPYTNHQGALLVFHDRCMIVKGGVIGGFMSGSLGGERAATFYFTQITGIEYNSGLINGVLEILTPSYQGSANKDFWQGTTKSRNSNSNDPWTLNNCLPLTKDGYKSAREMIDELKRMVAEFNRPVVTPSVSPPNLSDEVAKLADLLKQGVLTEEEFAQAKKRLLHP